MLYLSKKQFPFFFGPASVSVQRMTHLESIACLSLLKLLVGELFLVDTQDDFLLMAFMFPRELSLRLSRRDTEDLFKSIGSGRLRSLARTRSSRNNSETFTLYLALVSMYVAFCIFSMAELARSVGTSLRSDKSFLFPTKIIGTSGPGRK